MGTASVTVLPRRMPPTILVAETDVLLRCSVSDELRAHGFKVLEASSANDALTVLNSVPVDILFTVALLPGTQSGLDVAKSVLTRRMRTRIILSAHEEDIVNLQDLDGVLAFIRKPYLMSHLIELVTRTLNWPLAPEA